MKKHFFTGLFLSLSLYVAACSCSNYDNSFLYLVEAKHVFLATVMNVSTCGDLNKFEYNIWVETNYKGSLPAMHTIYTDCATSCTFQLEKGGRYLLFSDLVNNTIEFCELRIAASDTTFIPTKLYLDAVKYTRLDYITLHDRLDKKGFSAKMTVNSGVLDGIVNIYNPVGQLILKGMLIEGKQQGYFEIHQNSESYREVWMGNYQKGERKGNWIYKKIAKEKGKRNEYIIYVYENGEIVKELKMDTETQLQAYEPNKT